MLYARQTSLREVRQEGLPGLFCLAKCRAWAENLPLALFTDTDGQQDRSRPDSALAAYLDACSIED